MRGLHALFFSVILCTALFCSLLCYVLLCSVQLCSVLPSSAFFVPRFFFCFHDSSPPSDALVCRADSLHSPRWGRGERSPLVENLCAMRCLPRGPRAAGAGAIQAPPRERTHQQHTKTRRLIRIRRARAAVYSGIPGADFTHPRPLSASTSLASPCLQACTHPDP